MIWLIGLCLLVATLVVLVPRFHLAGRDHGHFDSPRPGLMRPAASRESDAVETRVKGLVAKKGNARRGSREGVESSRRMLDSVGEDADLRGVTLEPVDAGGVASEWVLAEGAHPERRLLYIHGGAFVAGSPRSHRPITAELSRRTGCSVLSIDYRLMPEHPRLAGIEDTRTACGWLARNGPQGSSEAGELFVAGDSAGGNLTLSLVAWLRDSGARQVDGAIALSPATDSCFASPSLRSNIPSDPILGPAFGSLEKVPETMLLWMAWASSRVRPSDPRVSPLRGDLANLPPILVHASESEMLLDDSVRYVNKARSAGSPVELHVWPGMVHVWQMFAADLPEAAESYEAIADFVAAQGSAGSEQRRAS
ncbi:MAG: alpha/beta hydrolase [Myxococcota bacterium]|nr:alpha/beta hydrolase [Myxococcota bacterium]